VPLVSHGLLQALRSRPESAGIIIAVGNEVPL
jgi:hypothetical protein